MTFLSPWFLLLLPLATVPLWLKTRQGYVYSSFAMVPEDRLSYIADLMLRYLVVVALVAMVLALAEPQGPITQVERTGKGAQLVFVIDRSVSMDDPFAGAGLEGNIGESKAGAAKRLMTKFVLERPNDMIGVVAFSNGAIPIIPLTQNREAILATINAAAGSGLLQTNIGAGLTSGIAMFEGMENTGSRAIVLLSDGAGRVTPKAKQKIRNWAESFQVHIYWIVLRQPDGISIFNPKYESLAAGEFVPAEVELHKFFQTLKTKYQAYEAEDPKTLQAAILDINKREKNPIRYTEEIPGRDLASPLISLATLLLILHLLLRLMGGSSWKSV
jgi:mxaC protein